MRAGPDGFFQYVSVKYGSVIFAFFGTVAADVHEKTPSFLIVAGVHAAAPSKPTIATSSIVTSVAPRFTATSETLIGCPRNHEPVVGDRVEREAVRRDHRVLVVLFLVLQAEVDLVARRVAEPHRRRGWRAARAAP